jgi:nitrite reductase/ring-hydroxylating ferredoxin subunit
MTSSTDQTVRADAQTGFALSTLSLGASRTVLELKAFFRERDAVIFSFLFRSSCSGSSPWSFSSTRLSVLASAMAVASANADVAVHLAAGWLRPDITTRAPEEGQGIVERRGLTKVARCRVDGTEQVVSARCTHLGGVVEWNDAEASWDCPLHGSPFAPGGSVLEGPATRPLHPAGG